MLYDYYLDFLYPKEAKVRRDSALAEELELLELKAKFDALSKIVNPHVIAQINKKFSSI